MQTPGGKLKVTSMRSFFIWKDKNPINKTKDVLHISPQKASHSSLTCRNFFRGFQGVLVITMVFNEKNEFLEISNSKSGCVNYTEVTQCHVIDLKWMALVSIKFDVCITQYDV